MIFQAVIPSVTTVNPTTISIQKKNNNVKKTKSFPTPFVKNNISKSVFPPRKKKRLA